MVNLTSIYTFCNKKIGFNERNNHYSNFKVPEKFSMIHFLKLFLRELNYEFIDSIHLKWCIRNRFTHSVIKKLVLTREIIIIATSNFLGNFL